MLDDIQLQTNFIRKENIFTARRLHLDVSVIERHRAEMKALEKLRDLDNRAFAARVDQTDTEKVKMVTERFGETGERAVLRLPFHDQHRTGEKRFFHFGEMHDQVFFHPRLEAEFRAVGRANFPRLITVQT